MRDPEPVQIDEIEDPDEAEATEPVFDDSSTFDVQPFDQDGNPIWEQF